MSERKPGFEWQTHSGETIRRGEVAVTPQSQALTVGCSRGGLVWNRPLAVVVERDGEERRIPIVDVTRWGQLALFGLSLVFVLVGLRKMVRHRRDHE